MQQGSSGSSLPKAKQRAMASLGRAPASASVTTNGERERPGTRRTGPWALASLLADAPGARVQLPARRLSRPWQTGHAVSRGHESRHMDSRWSYRLREHLNVGANAEGAGSPGPDERRSSTSSAVCHRGIATRRRGRRKQNVNRRQRGHTHPQRRDITMPPCEASTH